MKNVYKWDPVTAIFAAIEVVEDDYTLGPNETFTAIPEGGYMPITWTGSDWKQATPKENEAYYAKQQEEYLKEHPEMAPKPTDTQLALAQMGTQLATLTAENLKLKQDNAKLGQTVQALGMQVAQVVAKNGGTN